MTDEEFGFMLYEAVTFRSVSALTALVAHVRECRAALRRVPHGPDDDACPPGVHVSGCASLVHRPPDPRPACTCHVSEVRRLLGETT